MINPSAFPRPASEAHQHGMYSAQEGMTLRDYFAAKAMQGWLVETSEGVSTTAVAKFSYEMADAMLAARQTTKGDTNV